MVNTIKFSQFSSGILTDSTNQVVGLGTGGNVRFPSTITWTTGTRPAPPYNGLLGFNTTTEQYEYWNAISSMWIPLVSAVSLSSTYILKTPDGSLPNSFALSTLATGILKSSTVTGALSISAPLTSIDGLTTVADEMLYTTGANTYAVTSLTPFSRGLLANVDASSWRTSLGVPGLPV